VGLFYFGVKFIRYALRSWTPSFLQKGYGLAGDEAGYLSTVFDVAGFLGVITAGFVSDKLFESRRAKVAFLMLLGMLVGTALLCVLGSVSVLLFTLCIAVVGFMLYGPDALLTGAGAIDVGSPRVALQAAGIINGMGSVGSVVQEGGARGWRKRVSSRASSRPATAT
jgi:sugar phosphate permease